MIIKYHNILLKSYFFLIGFLLVFTLLLSACGDDKAVEERERITDQQLTLLVDFERKVTLVQQAIKNGILTRDSDYLIVAANISLDAYDLLEQIEDVFPDAEELTDSYQDYYAKLVTIITLFYENRLERGRASLMELEESHSFIQGKLRVITQTATGDGCVPCFAQ